MNADRFEQVEVTSAAALWDWLGRNHGRGDSVWLVTWKAARRDRYLSREEVLDALVAHGWTDGRRMALDAERTMQLISPRRTQAWAKSYKDRAHRLIAEGRMHAAGFASLAVGRASAQWSEMEDVDSLQVPDDLAVAFAVQPPAAARFDGFPPSYRRNVLRWIKRARTPATRAKRIALTAELSRKAEKVPQL